VTPVKSCIGKVDMKKCGKCLWANMLLFVKVSCLVSCAYSRHVEIDRCDSLVEVYR
jgi:hypothetical protein